MALGKLNVQEKTYKKRTLISHENDPPSIEMAGSAGSGGGLGNNSLSSARNNSSNRCSDTLQFTTWKNVAQS